MTDAEYYEAAKGGSMGNRLVGRARAQMQQRFMELMKPDSQDTILDFGASEFIEENANFLERHYPFPENITCAGIGDGHAIREHFPAVKYQQIIPFEALPFGDKQFDIAYSNAVFEHLGGEGNRLRMLREICRVAKRIFIAVPNRYFPVEHHTAIPFLHYHPPSFRNVIKRTNKAHWSDRSNLDFLSRKKLETELSVTSNYVHVEYAGIKLGPFSSNIIGVIHD